VKGTQGTKQKVGEKNWGNFHFHKISRHGDLSVKTKRRTGRWKRVVPEKTYWLGGMSGTTRTEGQVPAKESWDQQRNVLDQIKKGYTLTRGTGKEAKRRSGQGVRKGAK